MPSTPRAPSLRHRSAGNSLVSSICAARGAISFAVKSRTESRSMSMVSPCSNLRKFMVATLFRSIGAAGKRHQRLKHGSDVAAVVSVHLAARHGKRAAGADDLRFREQRAGAGLED